MEKWTRIKYQPNLPLEEGRYVTASDAHVSLSLRAAEEGMVLLKNEASLLPLSPGCKVSLFGKGTFDYVKGGGGSGDVHCKYIRNLYDAIVHTGDAEIFEPLADYYRQNVAKQYAGGAAPGMTVEPELSDELTRQARDFSDTAIVSISRFSGEGWDRSSVEYDGEFNPWPHEVSMPQRASVIFPDGDFYLTTSEKAMIAKVTAAFPKVIVVLNVGGIVDTSWIKNNSAVGAALLAWQGGMEGGLAAANILFGRVNPSGKLPDTFTAKLEDYPSTEHFHDSPDYVDYTEDIYVGYRYFETLPGAKNAVVYPFGYGLSYTDFAISVSDAKLDGQEIQVALTVKNTGNVPGKEVVQLYCSAPQGKLGKAKYSLCGFRKTELLAPGDVQEIVLTVDRNALASYDDTGLVQESAYVLEKGTYRFFLGNGLDALQELAFSMELTEDDVVLQLQKRMTPSSLPQRLRADGSYEQLPTFPGNDKDACLFPKVVPGTEEGIAPLSRGRCHWGLFDPYKGRPLMDVVTGEITLEKFMAQLTDDELLHLLGGQPNEGVANTFGIGNLPEYGIPNIMTADGPAGIRINPVTGIRTTAWPCGTMLASTWNPEIVTQIGEAAGKELKENNMGIWLAPALNIHRNPLCGRNFEYYSEDPLVAGIIGAAMVKGVQSNGVAACPKHFACNSKETNRKHSDSRVSERAIREIYLKAFEIIVKTADPWVMMSSYNVINGQRASENHDLLEGILRDEWGYQGIVVSDWWTRGEHYKELLAGNDVKMAAGYPDRVQQAMDLGAVTRADLERCAKRVLELIMKID